MKLIKLNEARFSYSDDLINRLKQYPIFADIQNNLIKDMSLKAEYRDVKHTIKNLLNLYSKENNIKSSDITYDEFIEWIEDNKSFEGYLTPIAMDYIHELPQETVINLSCNDPDFERAISDIINEYGWTDDEDEYVVIDTDLNKNKRTRNKNVSLRDKYYSLFSTWKLDKDDEITDQEKENETKMYKQTKDTIRDTYYAGHYIGESLKEEEVVQSEIITPENNLETDIQTEVMEDASINYALDQSINYLITKAWEFVSEINSTISTFDSIVSEFNNKEDLKTLLKFCSSGCNYF